MALDTDLDTDLSPDRVKRFAERAEDHHLVERFARAGLGSRGVVWLFIGALAASVAMGGGSSQQSDQSGALRALADTPGGFVLLLALALGFVCYSGYRFLCAAVGHRHDQTRKRVLHRLKSGGEGVIYAAAAVSSLRTAFGDSPDSEEDTRSTTATVMELPGGRTVVGLVGAVAVVVAVVLFVRALTHHHAERLENVPARLERPVVWLGVAGLGGRSLAISLVGGFLVNAALQFDPDEAKGLDAALDELARQPFGMWLLLLAAASLLCYGLWSLVEMLWRDV
jgi:hypothetical protein